MRRKLVWVLIILAVAAVILGIYVYVGPSLSKENRQIEAWIKSNNLNSYGDKQGTVYSNGAPVKSSLPSARFNYIKKAHPDQPWLK